MNKSFLVGRITKDLVLKSTQSGNKSVSFTLAVNKRGGDGADFINCVAWNKTAELMEQYLHKGSQIALEGHINTRSYDNKEGKKVYVTEVVADSVDFLDSKSSSTESE